MKDQIASRTKAYSFILKKVKEIDLAGNYRSSKITDFIDYISINDLIELKEGISNPSQQLVTNLKKLLQGATNEAEIDRYLVRPFIDQDSNHTKSNNP
ncbi:hypothetical protein ACFLY3_02485 [Chloroflexota bacterium]